MNESNEEKEWYFLLVLFFQLYNFKDCNFIGYNWFTATDLDGIKFFMVVIRFRSQNAGFLLVNRVVRFDVKFHLHCWSRDCRYQCGLKNEISCTDNVLNTPVNTFFRLKMRDEILNKNDLFIGDKSFWQINLKSQFSQ